MQTGLNNTAALPAITALVTFLISVLLSVVASNAHADVLLIETVEASKAIDLPRNGISMASVQSRWGAPLNKYPAVGEPPITRWQYSDYSVYFEHQRVLTTVLHPPNDN